MNSIPLELFHDIFSRLPVKSLGRCRCVSDQWRSILCSSDFTELFSTKSSTRPNLLFAMERSTNKEFLFFSSPQLDDKSSSSSLATTAYVQLKLSKDMPLELCGHASGLFCLRRIMPISKEESIEHVVCNPSKGQYGLLPTLRTGPKSFLGFDPIDKVFKVVSSNATYSSRSKVLNVFTLGTCEIKWRKIKSPVAHYPCSQGICISGVLYYLAQDRYREIFLVCFDVRSEEFSFKHAEFINVDYSTLVNYEGRLGLVTRRPRHESMTMWVQEDAEKHDWSEYTFTIPGDMFSGVNVSVVGASTCEIVLMSRHYYQSEPFYVFYYHPERNTVRRLEVQGFEKLGGGSGVYAFVDHVDDLTFDIRSWQLPQDVPPRFESINKFRALSLLNDV